MHGTWQTKYTVSVPAVPTGRRHHTPQTLSTLFNVSVQTTRQQTKTAVPGPCLFDCELEVCAHEMLPKACLLDINGTIFPPSAASSAFEKLGLQTEHVEVRQRLQPEPGSDLFVISMHLNQDYCKLPIKRFQQLPDRWVHLAALVCCSLEGLLCSAACWLF